MEHKPSANLTTLDISSRPLPGVTHTVNGVRQSAISLEKVVHGFLFDRLALFTIHTKVCQGMFLVQCTCGSHICIE